MPLDPQPNGIFFLSRTNKVSWVGVGKMEVLLSLTNTNEAFDPSVHSNIRKMKFINSGMYIKIWEHY